MKLDESFQSLLQLGQWDRLSLAECEGVARELWKVLPSPFRFHRVETYSLGEQKHQIAIFEWTGYPRGYHHGFFALIPGGEVTLGYDREHPFVPDQQQEESWSEETEGTMLLISLDAFLDQVMTPLRHVRIAPFLLEVLSTPLSPPPVFDETSGRKGIWRDTPKPIFYEETLRDISRPGFRFPTSNEWEYACAAGARSLFRWGNMTPPVSIPSPGYHKANEWDLHLQANAFGLLIGRYPYHWEFCAEPGVMRGGDGGTALHAGFGTFAEWLTLASAFHRKWYETSIYGNAVSTSHARSSSFRRKSIATGVYGVYLRRAFSLD